MRPDREPDGDGWEYVDDVTRTRLVRDLDTVVGMQVAKWRPATDQHPGVWVATWVPVA